MSKVTRLAMSLCCAFLPMAFVTVQGHAQDGTQTTLVQVSFSRVEFIYTGSLANYTGRNQRISFRVLPRELSVTATGEDLLHGSPDAFFAVRALALTSDDAAHSTQYCLDILRALAMSPNPNLELRMFLYVTQVSGTNFVVHTFDSCALQAPPP